MNRFHLRPGKTPEEARRTGQRLGGLCTLVSPRAALAADDGRGAEVAGVDPLFNSAVYGSFFQPLAL
jgi:hypothetical protein